MHGKAQSGITQKSTGLRPAKIVIDYEKTNAMLGLAHEVFDGILDVKLEGSYWWSFGLTSDLILLRGF